MQKNSEKAGIIIFCFIIPEKIKNYAFFADLSHNKNNIFLFHWIRRIDIEPIHFGTDFKCFLSMNSFYSCA